MNERINELIKSTNYWYAETNSKADWRLLNGVGEMEWNQKFAELIVAESIGILETEIELVKGYKSTACNDFDIRWHNGKIEHFTKLVEKSKKHFGVEL